MIFTGAGAEIHRPPDVRGNLRPAYRIERHHQLDDRLHELTERHYLSDSEQVEEATLKKRKLLLKDQMEEILRDYAASHA